MTSLQQTCDKMHFKYVLMPILNSDSDRDREEDSWKASGRQIYCKRHLILSMIMWCKF